MPNGIIVKGIGGFYYVKAGDKLYECKARGIFRKDELTPLPGDEVVISIVDEERAKGSLDQILPRKSCLVRPAVANVNQIIIVLAAKSPIPDMMLLDKLLLTAEIKNIHAVICVNKIDLDEQDEYKQMMDVYSKAGYEILPLSTKNDQGLEKLKDILNNKVTVFAGQSGVGKSSILNKIMNSWVMQTGEISERLERGKHTTRHAELIELASRGFILDTPGFSSFELSYIPFSEIELYYPEFEKLLNHCRFTGCSHINEPDCVVKQALADGLIDRGRYDRFVQIYNTLKIQKDYGGKK